MNVTIDGGARISFGDVGSGPPLVLLHPFPLDRSSWGPLLEALAKDHRVIAPDLRGFGESTPFTKSPSVDTAASDVAALLDELGITEPAIVAGISMGGYVALAFARRHPRRLRALVLCDTRAEADDAAGRAAREQTIALVREKGVGALVEKMLPKLVRDAGSDLAAEIRRIASSQPAAAVADALRMMRDRPDSTPGLASITVPTLVVVGAEDAITPPPLSEKLASSIPGARLETIADAAHLAPFEKPEEFARLLRSFEVSLPAR